MLVFFFFLPDFLLEKGHSTDFEMLPVEVLAPLLREFYASLRNKDGSYYSRSSYVNIRASLNRHLNSPPFSREINLMRDKSFMNSNQVFMGVLRQLCESGKDVTHHKKSPWPGRHGKTV